MKYTRELGRKLLELLPEDIKAVACGEDGVVCIFYGIPEILDRGWHGISNIIAKYDTCDDWENSLVVRGEKEKWVPKNGARYYLANPIHIHFYHETYYSNDNVDKQRIERGLIFQTPEEAIACAKKMLKAVGGEE